MIAINNLKKIYTFTSAIIVLSRLNSYNNLINNIESIKNSLMMSENGALASWVGAIVAPDTNLLLICNKGKEKDLI